MDYFKSPFDEGNSFEALFLHFSNGVGNGSPMVLFHL